MFADYAVSRLQGLTAGPNFPGSAASTVGTHDGNFHCDEALACGLLRHTSAFKDATIVRTRVPDVLNQCQVVVDVGAVYDVAKQRFDHHQKEFQGTMDTGVKQYNTRLSSAGLVYKHFGKEIVRDFCEYCFKNGQLSSALTEAQLMLVYDRVYKTFIEHIDGIDNGVEEFSPEVEGQSVKRNYQVTSTLSSRVGRLYPRWNQDQTRDKEDAAFIKAVNLTTTEFFEAVEVQACSWLQARSVVQKAFDAATTVHPSGQIVVMSDGGCPWKDHLIDIEKENKVFGRTLYVLYADAKQQWRIQCVPKENASFANRKDLPWKGLRDDALSQASGIDGCIFVHAGAFIGGNKTYDGAMQMALKALEA